MDLDTQDQNASRPRPCQPFSLEDTLHACEGTFDSDTAKDRPLRLLLCDYDAKSYRLSPYAGQDYVAISYCWPNSGSFERLGTSSIPTDVHTPNGLVISQHFSQFTSDAVFTFDPAAGTRRAAWIDYHCINQHDLNEKVAQVAILQRIYARARATLIILDDVALSADEVALVSTSGFRATPQTVTILRRILAARWFTRAWCSQELVLSREAVFFFHDSTNPSGVHKFASDSLWTVIDISRAVNASIPVFNQPRGRVPDTLVIKTSAWALGIVHELGCSDEYDKISLILNLIRYTYHFFSRPSVFSAIPLCQEDAAHVQLNVLKMANVEAIKRRDVSMLLLGHLSNPLHDLLGFGWCGFPLRGDTTAERWLPKDYTVGRDPDLHVSPRGLVARGILARVEREHIWGLWRDDTGLHVDVDGASQVVPSSNSIHSTWVHTVAARFLRDLILSVADVVDWTIPSVSNHARIILAYLLAEPDYVIQPPPIEGNLAPVIHAIFEAPVGQLMNIANTLSFLRPGNSAHTVFSTVLLDEGSILLASGHGCSRGLSGRLLFQPFSARPKMFSPPTVMTANSMVLEDAGKDGTHRCVGGVRGLGLIMERSETDGPFGDETQLCII